MHLEVFLKMKKPLKLSLLGKYKKNPKKPTGLFFLSKKPGFFSNPAWPGGRVLRLYLSRMESPVRLRDQNLTV